MNQGTSTEVQKVRADNRAVERGSSAVPCLTLQTATTSTSTFLAKSDFRTGSVHASDNKVLFTTLSVVRRKWCHGERWEELK